MSKVIEFRNGSNKVFIDEAYLKSKESKALEIINIHLPQNFIQTKL